MDTRRLKPFAQQCRQRLMQGVAERMHYWGFAPNTRQPVEPLEKIDGGYLFRGQVFDETDVPRQWQMLAGAVQTHGFAHVQETVAYTWFNRLMALKILARNQYQPDVLAFAQPGTPTPALLDEARRAQPPYLSEPFYRLLRPLLTDYTREIDAFARLFTAYCASHRVLHRLFDGADDVASGLAAALLLPADLLGDTGLLAFINTSTAISDADYGQVELIGWLYQFYIAERKDEVFAQFKKGQKAGPDDIPAATQIFTPRWIVSYLVENTLGRLYLDQTPDSTLGQEMRYLVSPANPTESSDRSGPSLSGRAERDDFAPFPVREGPGRSDDSVGFVGVESLRLIDPACGSGHILVTAFDLLMRIYDEEGYTKRQAVTAILTNHLVGLDLDERAAQLARFALLLKAGQYFPGVWDTDLIPAIWAMPDPWMPTDTDLLNFLGPDGRTYLADLHNALRLMQQAQNLGSIMRPYLSREGRTHIAERLTLYNSQPEHGTANDSADIFATITRQHLRHYLHVLLILTDHYAAVAANPPYLGQGNMNGDLKTYVNKHYPRSKADLFAVFMELSQQLTLAEGRWGMINQHSWMFLGSYEDFRKQLLDSQSLESMLHLGVGTFEEVNSKVIQSTAFVFKNVVPTKKTTGTYHRLTDYYSNEAKELNLLTGRHIFSAVRQSNFEKIPGEPVAYWVGEGAVSIFNKSKSLKQYADPKQGLATGDNDKFLRLWYEVDHKQIRFTKMNSQRWVPCNKGGSFRKWYGNNDFVIDWYNDGDELKNYRDADGKLRSRPQNVDYYFKKGITWSTITSYRASFRYSSENWLFETKGSVCFVKNDDNYYFIFGLLNSTLVELLLGVFSPTMDYHEGPLGQIPVIEPNNKSSDIGGHVQSCINIARDDWNSRETSWDFAENPLVSRQRQTPGSLAGAYVAWAEGVAGQFVQLHAHEESLNRIFIDLYGLQDELTPDVSPRDITLLPDELDKTRLMALVASGEWVTEPVATVAASIKRDVVARQLVSYVVGLFMGRYRLGHPGLHIAHPNPTPDELATYPVTLSATADGSFTIDPDGILPLLGEDGGFPDDLGRGVRHVLELVWGSEQLTDTVSWLEESLGGPRSAQSLDKYLTTGFWADHCRRYQKRPIYWLFSSPKGAFRALVYLHRMNDFTVATLRNKYLLPYIDRLARQLDTQKAAERPDLRRQEALSKALDECHQYDLLLRNAADGQFCPDLDAGVTRNYTQLATLLAPVK